jgi:hypothetical protein
LFHQNNAVIWFLLEHNYQEIICLVKDPQQPRINKPKTKEIQSIKA